MAVISRGVTGLPLLRSVFLTATDYLCRQRFRQQLFSKGDTWRTVRLPFGLADEDPRHGPYTIQLSADDGAHLEWLSKKELTAPYMVVVHAKIVLFAADGWRNDRSAKRLDKPRHVVGKWRKRFFERRLDGLLDLPRHGSAESDL